MRVYLNAGSLYVESCKEENESQHGEVACWREGKVRLQQVQRGVKLRKDKSREIREYHLFEKRAFFFPPSWHLPQFDVINIEKVKSARTPRARILNHCSEAMIEDYKDEEKLQGSIL